MKTKLFACLTMLAAFSLVGCGLIPEIHTDGGDDSISDDYNSELVTQKLDTLRISSGYKISYDITTNDGEGEEKISYTYAAKNDVYYLKGSENDETYWDLSRDDTYDYYYKSASDESFSKETYSYEDTSPKETIKEYTDAALVSWYGYYGAFSDMGAKKSETTMLGRSCDQYSITQTIMTIGARVVWSYTCVIEKEYGVCFKWDYSISGQAGDEGGSGAVKIECKEFTINPTITLPTV